VGQAAGQRALQRCHIMLFMLLLNPSHHCWETVENMCSLATGIVWVCGCRPLGGILILCRIPLSPLPHLSHDVPRTHEWRIRLMSIRAPSDFLLTLHVM
jgi:hypothetical protein